ncbi:Uma2 family endonuclease [Limnofasciculus baicalensis]|uniref:Uma2 family endonuclease n=1 Tax=Limnofasciculus baicalensis BBK-W-15 TaxID=2699891 RepID=A0AAE3GTE9_9CYAN|nr:Uma2 family endonuclease [Limnofasciculus baicalensis]MCP2730420.1 Uma2 family endonuclease [Limnofasciculus baicalensis BBK-W-15]
MVVSKDYFYISPEDYLEGEKMSPIKHEYIRGEIYAMAGGSDAHATIGGNLFALLRNHVRGSGCRAYASDMKVRIEAANCFYYPDVMVTCDERDRTPDDFKCYPRLIVEVLSPSTEAFNRGGKFADYRTIETLQEYVLISQDQVNVECFRRNDQGRWVLYTYSTEDDVCLESINFSTPMTNIYEDVAGLI